MLNPGICILSRTYWRKVLPEVQDACVSNHQLTWTHVTRATQSASRRGADRWISNIVINELSSAENGLIVFFFSASTGSESSYERAEWNNGAFTKALVEGLRGAAAIGSTGRITYNMLNVYIRRLKI